MEHTSIKMLYRHLLWTTIDITQTNVRTKTNVNDWSLQRNQQRNLDTLIQTNLGSCFYKKMRQEQLLKKSLIHLLQNFNLTHGETPKSLLLRPRMAKKSLVEYMNHHLKAKRQGQNLQ